LTLPLARALKRFAAPLLVFIFGIEDLLRLWLQVASTSEALETWYHLYFRHAF
jgi:hypothetical protein